MIDSDAYESQSEKAGISRRLGGGIRANAAYTPKATEAVRKRSNVTCKGLKASRAIRIPTKQRTKDHGDNGGDDNIKMHDGDRRLVSHRLTLISSSTATYSGR